MLKGSGLTQRTTVPLSAGLLVDTDRYSAALESFRVGDAAPIVEEFSRAARYAAVQGRELVDDLDEVRVESASKIKARSDAAVWRLNDLLLGQPVVNTAYVANRLGVSKVAAQAATTKLEQTGTLTESTKKVRYPSGRPTTYSHDWMSSPLRSGERKAPCNLHAILRGLRQ